MTIAGRDGREIRLIMHPGGSLEGGLVFHAEQVDLCCAVRSHCGEAGRTSGAGGEPLAMHRHHVAASAADRRGSQIVAPSGGGEGNEDADLAELEGQNWSVGCR